VARRTKLTIGVIAGVIVAALAGGIAWAAIPGANGVVQGCYDSGGNVKVVNALPCPKNHTPFSFMGTTAKAADSDKLDGLDSTAFLGATAKAADSDKLDGIDSTGFVPSNRVLVSGPYVLNPGEAETLLHSSGVDVKARCDAGPVASVQIAPASAGNVQVASHSAQLGDVTTTSLVDTTVGQATGVTIRDGGTFSAFGPDGTSLNGHFFTFIGVTTCLFEATAIFDG
jgi:hypothetical protein